MILFSRSATAVTVVVLAAVSVLLLASQTRAFGIHYAAPRAPFLSAGSRGASPPLQQQIPTTLRVSSIQSPEVAGETAEKGGLPPLPELGDDGIYICNNREDHAALLAHNTDKVVILKVFAPWCRACKGLEPKFAALANDKAFGGGGITWASLSIQHNKEFVKSLGVLALPTIQFYVGGKLLDTFPCGPSKVPMLKRKLAALLKDYVDPVTHKLRKDSLEQVAATAEEVEARVQQQMASKQRQVKKRTEGGEKEVAAKEEEPQTAAGFTAKERAALSKIPYFNDMSLADLDQVLDNAQTLTFEPGSILVREGRPGRMFYVVRQGEVEICQHTLAGSADPMVQTSVVHDTDSGYLGTVINRLGPGDYFGERALITGEPRAASIRATTPVTCWAWDKDTFPASSVLSGRTRNADDFSLLNDKYGVDLLPSNYHEDFIMKQLYESAAANQVRGSVNTPEPLMDVDEDYEEKMAEMVINGFIPETPESSAAPPKEKAAPVLLSPDKDEAIFSLLQRFQLIRRISKCVQYVAKTHARWGDAGSRTRRAMLVSRLTPAQRSEFADAFALVDTNKDGLIEWEELKRVVDVGALAGTKSGDLNEILEHPEQLDNNDENEADRITLEDCMGLMAEAEFYYLFRDIFAELDENDSGFVKARELDRVLSGVRDLISDDRKSVIDVEDKDMLIDYEQFSRMLLGTSLI